MTRHMQPNPTRPRPQAPIVHLNGTSREALTDQLLVALSATNVAMDRLADAAPHERDYYILEGTWDAARSQFESRMAALQNVADDLADILDQLLQAQHRP